MGACMEENFMLQFSYKTVDIGWGKFGFHCSALNLLVEFVNNLNVRCCLIQFLVGTLIHECQVIQGYSLKLSQGLIYLLQSPHHGECS